MHPAFGPTSRAVPWSAFAGAVALAHNVAGVELTLVTRRRALLVGRDASCDLTPCELRQVAVMSALAGSAVPPGVRAALVGGSLRDLGGGLFARHGLDGPSERWFTTEMCAEDLFAIAERCELDGVDEVACRVGSDLRLGVTTVCMHATGRPNATARSEHHLDAVARWLLDQCVVEELLQQVRAEAVSSGQ